MRYWLNTGVVCLIILGGAAWCLGPGTEQARSIPLVDDNCTHYVDNQTPTDGDGSLGTPWNNISGHVDDLEAGDVLCVRGDPSTPGRVYTEPTISLNGDEGTSSGTEEAPITLRTYPEEHVVLLGKGANILDFIQVSHWQVDGFAFDKDSRANYAIHFHWANSNVVRNCQVYNGTGEGIHFTYGEHNVVENCTIHDFSTVPYKDAHCILIAGGKHNVIRNNEIYDCTGDGIQFYYYHDSSGNIVENNHFYTTLGPCGENAVDVKIGGPQQTIIRGNVMHGYRPNDGSCGGSGGTVGEAIIVHIEAVNVLIEGNEIYDSGSGILVYGDNDIQIVNNIIHDIVTDPNAWTNIGIYVSGAKRVDIVNNTLVNVPREALRIGDYSISDLNILNNLFYNTGQSYFSGDRTGAVVDYNGWFNADQRIAGPHDVVGSDPLFVSSDDYHLQGNSPVIDVGDNAHAPAYDFDGNPRPYGPTVDLGALEVQEPLPVTDLRVSEAVTSTESVTITLKWTAPGQAGQSSSTHHYELRHDDQVITQENWDQAAIIDANIAPGQPDETQYASTNLPWSGTGSLYVGHVYFALRVFDAESRESKVSNPCFWPAEYVFLPLVKP